MKTNKRIQGAVATEAPSAIWYWKGTLCFGIWYRSVSEICTMCTKLRVPMMTSSGFQSRTAMPVQSGMNAATVCCTTGKPQAAAMDSS